MYRVCIMYTSLQQKFYFLCMARSAYHKKALHRTNKLSIFWYSQRFSETAPDSFDRSSRTRDISYMMSKAGLKNWSRLHGAQCLSWKKLCTGQINCQYFDLPKLFRDGSGRFRLIITYQRYFLHDEQSGIEKSIPPSCHMKETVLEWSYL